MMIDVNNQILEQFIRQEQEANKELLELFEELPDYEDETVSAIFTNLYDKWKKIDTVATKNLILSQLESNFENFWVNPKYNKDLEIRFNMMHLQHSGPPAGTTLHAYAVNFDYNLTDLPIINVMDKRLTWLSNIDCLPTFELLPLSIVYNDDCENEAFWQEYDWELIMFWELFEATSYKISHTVLSNFCKMNKFTGLKTQRPFYFTMNEHDCGKGDKVVFVLT